MRRLVTIGLSTVVLAMAATPAAALDNERMIQAIKDTGAGAYVGPVTAVVLAAVVLIMVLFRRQQQA